MADDDLIQAFALAVVDTIDGSQRDWDTREAFEHELLRRLAERESFAAELRVQALADNDLINAFSGAVVASLDGTSPDWARRASIEHELLRRLSERQVSYTNARQENANLRFAAQADDMRLLAACERTGVLYVGCDTPDALAEEILKLRDELRAWRCAAGDTTSYDVAVAGAGALE